MKLIFYISLLYLKFWASPASPVSSNVEDTSLENPKEEAGYSENRPYRFSRVFFPGEFPPKPALNGYKHPSDCLPNLVPPPKMRSRLRKAINTCVKSSVKRTMTFKEEMPCQEIRDVLKKDDKPLASPTAGGMPKGSPEVEPIDDASDQGVADMDAEAVTDQMDSYNTLFHRLPQSVDVRIQESPSTEQMLKSNDYEYDEAIVNALEMDGEGFEESSLLEIETTQPDENSDVIFYESNVKENSNVELPAGSPEAVPDEGFSKKSSNSEVVSAKLFDANSDVLLESNYDKEGSYLETKTSLPDENVSIFVQDYNMKQTLNLEIPAIESGQKVNHEDKYSLAAESNLDSEREGRKGTTESSSLANDSIDEVKKILPEDAQQIYNKEEMEATTLSYASQINSYPFKHGMEQIVIDFPEVQNTATRENVNETTSLAFEETSKEKDVKQSEKMTSSEDDYGIDIVISDLVGVDELNFIAEVIGGSMVSAQKKPEAILFPTMGSQALFMLSAEEESQTDSELFIDGKKHQIFSGPINLMEENNKSVQQFLLHLMALKLGEYMQECIARELELVDENGIFRPSLFKEFISMAFDDRNCEEMSAISSIIDECDLQTGDVKESVRPYLFSVGCFEPKIAKFCSCKGKYMETPNRAESNSITSDGDKYLPLSDDNKNSTFWNPLIEVIGFEHQQNFTDDSDHSHNHLFTKHETNKKISILNHSTESSTEAVIPTTNGSFTSEGEHLTTSNEVLNDNESLGATEESMLDELSWAITDTPSQETDTSSISSFVEYSGDWGSSTLLDGV